MYKDNNDLPSSLNPTLLMLPSSLLNMASGFTKKSMAIIRIYIPNAKSPLNISILLYK